MFLEGQWVDCIKEKGKTMTAQKTSISINYNNLLLNRFTSSDLVQIANALNTKLNNMFKALNLPQNLVDLNFAESNKLEDREFQLFIGENPYHYLAICDGEHIDHITNSLFTRIFSNRDLLVTNEFVNRVWKHCVNVDLPESISEQNFIRKVTTESILRGCPPHKPLNYISETEGIEYGQKEVIIESAFCRGEKSNITLSVSSNDVDCIDPQDLAEVNKRIFQNFGVSLPQIETKVSKEFGDTEGNFRVALNNIKEPINLAINRSIIKALKETLISNLHLRLSLSAVDELLGRFNTAYPMVVFNTIEVLGTYKVFRVLRYLVEEGVSIRDLRGILGALLEIRGSIELNDQEIEGFYPTDYCLIPRQRGTGNEPVTITEMANYVRIKLRDQICFKLAPSDGEINVRPLSRRINSRLKKLPQSALTQKEMQKLLMAIGVNFKDDRREEILLVSFPLRRALWSLLRRFFPRIKVLCPQELSELVRIQRQPQIDCKF